MTLLLSCRSPMGPIAILAIVSCATHVAADTQSVQSGDWSDPATWSTGQLPDASDAVTISAGDKVVYDLASTRVAGITVEDGATLAFDPDMDATLETDENVLVVGRLEMRPQAPNNTAWRNSIGDWRPYFLHTLRFVDVDETAFVGGGMDPVASDVGLWVRGDGVLDIAGAQKSGWVRLAGGARAGDTSIQLDRVPIGWRVGDVITIVPTEHPNVGNRSYNGFEERTIGAVDGARVVFSSPLNHDHPEVTDPFSGKVHTAEVLNLSRNVTIEGTGNGSASFQPSDNGRAHINIRSAAPQSVRYAELVLLGPRGPHRRDPTDGVPGRYPLHFHHSGDGSRGSLVEGVAVRDAGNHAFVPHASHGVTFRDTVAYDSWEDAYWWDGPEPGVNDFENDINATHDVVYDRAVAALIKDDPSYRGFRLTGFVLRHGRNPIIRNSVAVGIQGNNDASGFLWPEGGHSVWEFSTGNIAHNNKVDAIFVWQNDSRHHVIENLVAYNNGGAGIDHGAYGNRYQYIDVDLFNHVEEAVRHHAGNNGSDPLRPDGYSMAFDGVRTDNELKFLLHKFAFQLPVLYKDCSFTKVRVSDFNEGAPKMEPTRADFVNCTRWPTEDSLEPADFALESVMTGMEIRVQRPDGTAYQLHEDGTSTPIAAFYETGSGGGDDTEPPTPPSDLTATVVSSTQVDLSWTGSSDNVGVTGYRIYRDGSLVATVTGTSHSDAGLSASTTYTYEVTAIDAAGNESARSSPVSATTLADETDAGDDGSTDDGSTDDGSTDDGSTDDGSTDGGSTDDGSTDDGSTDDGSTDDGSTDDGSSGGGDLVTAWDGPQDFNGTSDFVNLGAIDVSGTGITIAARVSADDLDGDARIVSKATSTSENDHWWMLSERSNRLRFRLKTDGVTSTLIGGRLSPGVSTHVAATYDGSTMRIYINGNEVGSLAKSATISTDASVEAWIGANPDGSNFFDGVIEDVRIYDRALSESEIAALHAGG